MKLPRHLWVYILAAVVLAACGGTPQSKIVPAAIITEAPATVQPVIVSPSSTPLVASIAKPVETFMSQMTDLTEGDILFVEVKNAENGATDVMFLQVAKYIKHYQYSDLPIGTVKAYVYRLDGTPKETYDAGYAQMVNTVCADLQPALSFMVLIPGGPAGAEAILRKVQCTE